MSLYLRHRPQTFSELSGQDHIATTLKGAVGSGRTSHAYLFTGPRGTGKTSTARILARALNCTAVKDGDPCLACESCRLIGAGGSIDLIEIDAASNRGIDEIRELKEKVRFTPASARYKVFIIDEVHMLTKEAFNALLKTLEEPPSHVVFILATTEPHKVPETVISRCQRFDFGRVGQGELVGRLAQIGAAEGFEIEEGVLEAIAGQADGGFRDAIGLLDQLAAVSSKVTLSDARELLSLSADETAEVLVRSVAGSSLEDALGALSSFRAEGGEVKVLYRSLLRLVRNLLLTKTADAKLMERELSGSRLATVRELAGEFSLEQLFEMARLWQNAIERGHELIPGFWLELSLVQLIPSSSAAAEKPVAEEAPVPVQEAAPVRAKPVVPAAPAAPPQARSTSPKLGHLQRDWPDFVSRVRGYNHSVAACLQVATPESIEGEVITIAFPYKFHRERIDELKNRRIAEKALSEHFGGSYQIKSVLRERTVEQPPDDLVEAALEILGGEVVG